MSSHSNVIARTDRQTDRQTECHREKHLQFHKVKVSVRAQEWKYTVKLTNHGKARLNISHF